MLTRINPFINNVVYGYIIKSNDENTILLIQNINNLVATEMDERKQIHHGC